MRELYKYVIGLCASYLKFVPAVSEDLQVDLAPDQAKIHPPALSTTLITTPCEPSVRVDTLRHVCARNDTQRLLKHFHHRPNYLYVNDEEKYVACLPLKAGCTTWKVILANNTIRTPLPSSFDGGYIHGDGLKRYKIYRLHSYSKQDQNKILQNYYKFIVVRHPLDRLISGHNDKILRGELMYLRNQIIKICQRDHGDSNYDLTALLEYIVHKKYHMDDHFFPATFLCDPCNVKYDKIVKLETQNKDLLEVLPHLGPYGRGTNAHQNHHGTGAAANFS